MGVASRRKGTRAGVDEHQRKQYVHSRLQALEDDGLPLEVDNSDEEFHIEDVLDEEVSLHFTSASRRRCAAIATTTTTTTSAISDPLSIGKRRSLSTLAR